MVHRGRLTLDSVNPRELVNNQIEVADGTLLVDAIGKHSQLWAKRVAELGFGADRLATFLDIQSQCTARACQNPRCQSGMARQGAGRPKEGYSGVLYWVQCMPEMLEANVECFEAVLKRLIKEGGIPRLRQLGQLPPK